MKVSLKTMSLMDMASSSMRMVNPVMKETGWQELCMGVACTNGRMAADTRVTIRTIRRTALVYTCGLMDAPTMVCGKMATRMVREQKSQRTWK